MYHYIIDILFVCVCVCVCVCYQNSEVYYI